MAGGYGRLCWDYETVWSYIYLRPDYAGNIFSVGRRDEVEDSENELLERYSGFTWVSGIF